MPRPQLLLKTALFTLAILSAGCGGGGGSSGGGGGGGSAATDEATFQGFGFQVPGSAATDVAPLEDLEALPPTLGAPLNVDILFRFDGVPAGPLDGSTLPVFTTPADVTLEAGASSAFLAIPAKGSYSLEVDDASGTSAVRFSPFVPTAPLQVALSAPAEAVPGLLPDSLYTVQVVTGPGTGISNLTGEGGLVQFGTTSNEAAFFPKDGGDGQPPVVVASTPEDGAQDFFPGSFASVALGSGSPLFPEGPGDVLLTYDRALTPTAANLFGNDLDGDGLVEPSFGVRAASTSLLIGHQVPAGAFGPHGEFGALSALSEGQAVDLAGEDVVLQQGDVLPGGASPGMLGRPQAMEVSASGDLLWVVFDGGAGTDLLAVADHVLGDPSFAMLSVDGPGGAPLALETGFADLVGLASLPGGRLVAFDGVERRVVELAAQVERQRPSLDQPELGPPILVGLDTVSDELFRSEVWAAGDEVLDLASSPSGRLFAVLGSPGGDSRLVELGMVDPDLDGAFEVGEALPLASGVEVALPGQVAAVEFIGEQEVLALDRGSDALLRVDLTTGGSTVVVADVAAFGFPLAGLPDGLSPASCFALGQAEFDVAVQLLANDDSGAVVLLEPAGVLPIGQELTVIQRNTVTSLFGANELNAGDGSPVHPLGVRDLLTVRTAEPLSGLAAPIDDVFLEEFVDTAFEEAQPLSTSPVAHWAEADGGLSTEGLRASVGVPQVGVLGDFNPIPGDDYDPSAAYGRSSATKGDPSFNFAQGGYRLVLLDTDAQEFPLADGSTPGVTTPTTVFGGTFAFHDVIIPEGVRVVVKGSNPLRIIATGRVEIRGILDVGGIEGLSDDTFNSGFLPVPGGPGGPGAGRGGDGHPTRFDPSGTGTIDQYVTPETGEQGFGPVVSQAGLVSIQQIGGRGGLCSLGYDPSAAGIPKLNEFENREEHRVPGGGGGSFYSEGDQARDGSGTYLVQSDSTWFPFSRCSTDDKITNALYGNDEFICAGLNVNPLQCVYMLGTPDDPVRILPGGLPGDLVFTDGDPDNDFIGPGGELPVLVGGQGGGGGASRVDSMRHRLWAIDSQGSCDPFGPPFYPNLSLGLFFSPTLYDAKGGAGGGGGGACLIQAYSDIVVGRSGYINARGGHGGGGEVVQNSNFSGGGGGGSGGAVILQAAGDVILEADPGHKVASYISASGTQGAAIEVSGGFGRDARTEPDNEIDFIAMTYEYTRSDGGQGGMGLVQLQSGGPAGMPTIQQGSFVFAKRRSILKLGKWTGDSNLQEGHESWQGNPNNPPPDELRYVEMLHYRYFEPDESSRDRYMVLNGTHPPIIPSDDGDTGQDDIHEFPEDSGSFWFDTPMLANEATGGRLAVREPQPEFVMESYDGFDPETFEEPFMGSETPPGSLYDALAEIPLSIALNEPDGTPLMVEEDGQLIFDPDNTVGRLPLVHPDLVAAPFGSISRGTSVWLDFAGATLRQRAVGGAVTGRTPPFFAAFQGTYNGASAAPPSSALDGQVVLGAAVAPESIPARHVANAGVDDPGLSGDPSVPFNDIKVDAPDGDIGLEDVLTDNASVTVLFQGAYPVRAGSHVPDEATLSEWVTDVTRLSGYSLVRFQVVFDLGVSSDLPFGLDSYRPLVDYLRLRSSY